VDLLDTSAAGGLVVRGGTLRVLSYAVGVLVSVLGASLLLRHLSQSDFARYTTILSITTIIAALTDLGLTGVGVREAATADRAGRERVVRNLLGMRLTATTVGLAGACLFSIAVGYPTVMTEGILIAGVALLVLVTYDSYTIPLQVSLLLGRTASLDALRQICQTLTVVLLVIAGASLLPFTASQLPGALAAAAIAAYLIRSQVRLTPTFDRAQWVHMARELLPFAAASAIGAIYFRVEIIVLSLVSSELETALFGAAFRITEVVVGIPWLVASAALPVVARAAHNDRERLAYVLRQLFGASLTAGAGIAVAIFLGAQFALEVVAGPKYDASVEVLQIQSITVLFTFLVTQWGFALLALRRTRALLVVNAVALTVAVGLAVGLGSEYGAPGASVALVVAEALLATGYAISLTRADRSLSVGLGLVPRVALAVAAAIGIAELTSLPSLPATIVGLIVYLGGLALLGALPPEVRELLPRRRRTAG
jgi:O-antigen/teichoic acid export membrane protein